jgi:hypothetical protein
MNGKTQATKMLAWAGLIDVKRLGRWDFIGSIVVEAPHNTLTELPDNHALAYRGPWHIDAPETCWYWQGMDGLSNKHMADA